MCAMCQGDKRPPSNKLALSKGALAGERRCEQARRLSRKQLAPQGWVCQTLLAAVSGFDE